MQSRSFLFKVPASISRTLKSCLDLGLLLIPSSALLPAYRSLKGELLPMHLITLYQPCYNKRGLIKQLCLNSRQLVLLEQTVTTTGLAWTRFSPAPRGLPCCCYQHSRQQQNTHQVNCTAKSSSLAPVSSHQQNWAKHHLNTRFITFIDYRCHDSLWKDKFKNNFSLQSMKRAWAIL